MTVRDLIRELERHDPALSVRETFFSPVTGAVVESFRDGWADIAATGRYLQLRTGP